MAEMHACSNVKSAELSIVVTRADGTVEDLGVVAKYERNKFKEAIQKIIDWIKSKVYALEECISKLK